MHTQPPLAVLLASLYEDNPDAVAVYDRGGALVSCNPAALAMANSPIERLLGTHYLEHIHKRDHTRFEPAFAGALAGSTQTVETTIRDRRGAIVPVEIQLFPARMGDGIAGVFAQVRNTSARQAERIRELYLAAAARGGSHDVQLRNTLVAGCRMFAFDYGFVTRFDAATVVLLSAVGEGAGLNAGAIFPKEKALSRHLVGERQTLYIPDLDEPPWRGDPARNTAPLRSYVATKLIVHGHEFGALAFGGRHPHRGVLNDLDRDLLQLMALFVAAAIERAQYAERIEQLAFFDTLTGLPNRVLFDDRIRQAMGAAKRYDRDFAVMYLDLDDFKAVNDRHGHPLGDRVLKSVADRLLGVLRESDTIARFGGDEFVILQPVVNGATDAAALARKIVSAMQVPIEVGEFKDVVHTSLGIALYPKDGTTPKELMDCADRALYKAKRAGRNRWLFSSEDAPST